MQMYDDFDECCAVLVAKLGDKDFFFGDKLVGWGEELVRVWVRGSMKF